LSKFLHQENASDDIGFDWCFSDSREPTFFSKKFLSRRFTTCFHGLAVKEKVLALLNHEIFLIKMTSDLFHPSFFQHPNSAKLAKTL
jgi:hypothetical protein